MRTLSRVLVRVHRTSSRSLDGMEDAVAFVTTTDRMPAHTGVVEP